jgi:hypothetical protein
MQISVPDLNDHFFEIRLERDYASNASGVDDLASALAIEQ